MKKIRFWVGFMLSLLILGILLGLGSWQIARLQWKEGLIAERNQMMQANAQIIADENDLARLRRDSQGKIIAAQKLSIHGRFLTDKPVFLGNKFVKINARDDLSGFHVLLPFEIVDQKNHSAKNMDKKRIMVDVGFLAWPNNGTYRPQAMSNMAEILQLYQFGDKLKTINITGFVGTPIVPSRFTPAAQTQELLWFVPDLADMAAKIPDFPVIETDFMIILTPDVEFQNRLEAIAFTKNKIEKITLPQPQNLPELTSNHLGYALTWFSLAAIWLGFCAIFWVGGRNSRRRAANSGNSAA